jgi:predicted small secreted protein
MIKIIISVVAALVVTVGALTITGAGNDMSSAPQPARNDARSPLGASAALAGPREGLGDL